MHRFLYTITLAILLASPLRLRAGKPPAFIFTPTNGTGPFPVAVWLHGYRGYSTNGYMPGQPPSEMQKHADALGAVIIGFPATVDLGDGTQQWSEDPVTDDDYIQSRLKEIGKTVKLDFSRVGLFGFSQGAMVAADLATLYPAKYMGAVIMSPGGLGKPKVATVGTPEHQKQVYYCFCGEDENPYNVNLTKAFAKHLETVLGAKVTLKLYPGVSKHTRPPDFKEKLPEWMAAILKLDPKR